MSDLETTTAAEASIDTDMEIEDWDDAKDYATELVENWMTAHDVDPSDEILVKYSGATWQRLSGSAPAVASSLPMIFKVNGGDYTLTVKYDSADQSLTIVRYSHDEPTGATHVIEKIQK
jgi:hypothetical protein